MDLIAPPRARQSLQGGGGGGHWDGYCGRRERVRSNGVDNAAKEGVRLAM